MAKIKIALLGQKTSVIIKDWKQKVHPHTLTSVAVPDTRFAREHAIHPRAYARGFLGVGVNPVVMVQ